MLIILLVTSIAPLVRAAGQESTSLQDKTLVVWAAASNLTQQGGSALTIDDGQSHFDGIVFGEITAAKWMPGSDYFRRTIEEQGNWPAETANGKTFVQMAIVYHGREVRVFRDGRDYASYTMPNSPQPFGPAAVALFGRRVYPVRSDNLRVCLFAQGGTAVFKTVQAWEMAPANPY